MCCVLCFVLSAKQSGVLECHLFHISKNKNYELCILAGFFVTTGKKNSSCPEKKSSSRLSGRCAIIIMTGEKKDTVVCLAGCAVVSVFGSVRK